VKKSIFYQPEQGYCYNSDTLFLYNFIKTNSLPKGNILDIGSGSGVLGILIARDFPKIKLFAYEKQEIFQFLTKKNCEINSIQATIYKGDFLESEISNYFDFIISNPPFYDSNVIQSNNLNLNIARYNNHLPIEEFLKKVAKSLKPKGYFIFCYDSKQFQKIAKTLLDFNLTMEIVRFVYPKVNKNSSLVMIKCRKNSKSSTIFLPPLYNFSEEVANIYKQANTYTFKVKG
jgi:tRNA1(Val) A37 N6-methylase TrmN6